MCRAFAVLTVTYLMVLNCGAAVVAQDIPAIPPTKDSVCPENNPAPDRRQARFLRILGRHSGPSRKPRGPSPDA
jgi:hypothetical protein